MEKTKIEGYEYICHQSGVCDGRPTIEGTRIEPWHIHGYGTVEEILEDFSHLTSEQVEEALRFYDENTLLCETIKKENKEAFDEE